MKRGNIADKSNIMACFKIHFLVLFLFLSLPSEAEALMLAKNTPSPSLESKAQNVHSQSQSRKKAQKLKNTAPVSTQKSTTKTRKTASTSGTEQINYPPPPANKHELPAPVQESIQAIEDVCQRVDSSFDQRRLYLKPILKNLKAAIAFYTENHFEQINPARLGEIDGHLFNIDMEVYWDMIYIEDKGANIEGEFLLQHCMVSRLSSRAGPKCIEYDWARKVYRGLYCLSRGRLPEEEK